ncbi:MAG: hypothetical protein V7606_4105, partial [Burkholderiales bacterium]
MFFKLLFSLALLARASLAAGEDCPRFEGTFNRKPPTLHAEAEADSRHATLNGAEAAALDRSAPGTQSAELVQGSQFDELREHFDTRLKNAESALLLERKQRAQLRSLAAFLALALVGVLMASLAFYIRKRAVVARIEMAHSRALAAAEAEADNAKRAFLANMSHELRSPLNVILGFTQLLERDTGLPEETRQDLGIVHNSGQHLQSLINQVLDLSRIQAGRATLDEVDCDLYALLDELEQAFGFAARKKGLRLEIDSAADVPRYIRADAIKLRQVLINLLDNAVKFSSEGCVALNVSVSTSGHGQTCALGFAVIDTGPGIADDELRKLGCAFVQGQAGRVARIGTGLGLAISCSFVQLMGGELRFSSWLGEGTTVSFEIAVRVGEAAAMAPRITRGWRIIALAPGQPAYRILVADDIAENRQLLTRVLTPLGFEVREASNGAEAIAVWQEWQPQLISMDMRMPVMDGREATRHIRSTLKGNDTVIIAIITAGGVELEREAILADGCDDVLRKPFRERDLLEMMHRYLGVEFVYEGAEGAATVPPANAAMVGALP